MTQLPGPEAYRSLFLEPDWAHQRYHGWHVVREEEGGRVLEKRIGPLTRRLILAEGLDAGRLASLAGPGEGAWCQTVLHDFDASGRPSDWRPPAGYRPGEEADLLLNTLTLVIDLQLPPEQLQRNLRADFRRRIRQAEQAGLAFRVVAPEEGTLLQLFFRQLGQMGRSRGFGTPRLPVLQAMHTAGQAQLFVAERAGRPLSYLFVYLAGAGGLLMLSVAEDDAPNEAGPFLHWQVICWLKAHGRRWYDLGGVPSQDPRDGIFCFKSGFGGRLTDLGREWVREGRAYRAVAWLHGLAGRWRRK